MRTVNLYEAKTKLSELVAAAAGGEEIIIARNGDPIARLTALKERRRSEAFDLDRGLVEIASDFDAPLEDFTDYAP